MRMVGKFGDHVLKKPYPRGSWFWAYDPALNRRAIVRLSLWDNFSAGTTGFGQVRAAFGAIGGAIFSGGCRQGAVGLVTQDYCGFVLTGRGSSAAGEEVGSDDDYGGESLGGQSFNGWEDGEP